MEPVGPQRYRFLATYLAGRAVDVAQAAPGQDAYTNGSVIFVPAADPAGQQHRQVLVQAALLGAGSLDRRLVKRLRGRSAIARRYLALEGHRVLAELAPTVALAAALRPDGEPRTTTAAGSLEMARGTSRIADPPAWFGVIRPAQLLASSDSGAAPATDTNLRTAIELVAEREPDDEDEAASEESKVLKLFENPLFSSRALMDFLRKLLGEAPSRGDDPSGGEFEARSIRPARAVGASARPLPTRINFVGDRPGAALGIGGALHPEWDVFNNRYRADWCRVIDFPLTEPTHISAAHVSHDDELRRRLARVGLGPKLLRARPDGDEIDIEALVDLFVDLRSGCSPTDAVYTQRRNVVRNLGVLILLDASGSATDADLRGNRVHDHQRRAAATVAMTLEELGDRVAIYAFRSHGRHAVHLPAIKTFGQRFGAPQRARLNQLEPSGYTRLGAAIRGAGEILNTEAGTPNRLLLVLSDGCPYDDGYDGRYAEADANKALEELRGDGVACLCLSIGSATAAEELERVFGSARYVSAATLAEVSPRMDEMFLTALRERAAPGPA
ncbi:VWA domain-containing protein [Mycobacterium intracellulare]|uniref:VWA domain-containing protein n=1 Tax=Mycobacterium intracellulare TaxID=1767 RepID=A0AAE4R8T3_MYCIT|nr:VWA domain-containing protein [Mycobacterium intracellulare]MCA2318276.1 VWA domain-containing protein [Mycobacterium intracellulare]MCA2340562.1 VWA domain-containing protein [Mycobacterium intracellulare]MDV6974886.1 VWA domain-containing protein [Mycobacterium intracellulare]MDV6980991.1 VWA domain-containing protein [Mycobacterium intracellulare]MDV7011389.1 VWA domain-containing protein [Mycobacterium intracellulare]